ncbi:MAG: ABC transporter permease [Beijerinckiaceae bacterium]|nr:ABC transporter permease [Beijerinckiaceae bacterium]
MTRVLRLLAVRGLSAIPTLLIVACGAFLLLEFAPGDAVDAYLAQTGGDAGFAAELRRSLGLGGTFAERLAGFLVSLATLDLGQSVVFARPVASVIAERLPNTLLLMASTTLFAGGLGLGLGMLAGRRPGSLADHGISTAALLLLAIPNFWLGLLLVVALAVSWPLFPVAGIRSMTGTGGPGGALLDLAHHLVLPTIALGAGYIALYLRTLRAGMVEAWQADHVRAAQARGLRDASVLRRGVVRPALLPGLVVAGQNIGTLVGGSVVVETVFAIPGMGRLAFEAVTGRDTALLVGVVMSATLLVLVINLIVDLAMAWLDPRLGSTHA